MSMTSSNEEIKKITKGYGIGKLYNANIKNEIKLSENEGVCFDTTTFNFHLYPDDLKVMKDISDEETKLRHNIVDELANEYKIQIDGKGKNGNIQPLKSEKYQGANGLFKFISLNSTKEDGITYILNFMRYFIDKDNAVNCILKSIQFERRVNKSINEKRQSGCEIYYPTSYQSQSEKYLESIVNDCETKSFYYNPKVEFGDYKAIASAFVKFVEACEK